VVVVPRNPTMKRRLSEPRQYTYAGESAESRAEELKWGRAPLPPDFSAATHGVTFQQMDATYVIDERSQRPVIKMYGCSQEGWSVALSVHNFAPYTYVALPPDARDIDQEQLCASFRAALDARLKEKVPAKQGGAPRYVLTVELVHRMSIMHYQQAQQPFLKITLSSPKLVPPARSILEATGLSVEGLGTRQYATYESNIVYVLRFMVDHSIGGASWVHLPAGKYQLVTDPAERTTSTTLEASIDCGDLQAHPVDDERWAHLAPLRLLSFDIECAGRPGIFPEPSVDPVIQIANYCTVQGQDGRSLADVVFVLDTCPPIAGCDVRCYRTERELLTAWSRFVQTIDPDLFTGYNIVNFDLGYLKARAEALKLRDFDKLTRVLAKRMSVKDAKFSSAQTGARESKEWSIEGRIVFDMYQVVQRDHKLSSYTLNNVAAHFLKQQKEDVHHSQITKLHQGSPEDRHRLAVYCRKDAYLPQKLIENLMSLVNYVEMARVTGVPFSFLLTRGQGIKVVSQILRKAREMDLVLPVPRGDRAGDDVGFQGAKVFEPKVGFYDKPIPTLDFSSLYPSIMQAHNLCHSTLIPDGAPVPDGWQEGVDYATSPMGHRFVLASRRKGILPLILDQLLAARGRAKKLMAAATDKFKQKVYNGRQLALKVSANSVYGFTGQSVGSLPCVEISSSVTGYGRDMIVTTAQVVESHFSIANGYKHDAQVIYGDTDSVMICLGVDTVAEAMAMGKEGAALVTTKFKPPIKLEFEKVYYPYLLMSKKKYAGMWYSTSADKPDKMDCKGIESVRRDNCGVVRYAVDTVLRRILIDRNIEAAVAFCKDTIGDILQNRIDLSLLIVTKAYSRAADAYKSPQAHVELAQRMLKRDPATAPAVGDRIPYVIVKGDKKSKMSQRAEDPLYVLQHDVPIDAQYYIEQLVAPLCRILGPIVEDPHALLTTGEHTRHIVLPRSKGGAGDARGGGLGKFVVVRENCLGCKAPLPSGEQGLCGHCRPRAVDIYGAYMEQTREKEMQFARLWTYCQQCQGSVLREVVCAANDCPIFYKRVKVRNECADAHQALARFDSIEW
jgi:DNA polymerase delta subunit 1